MKGIARAHTNIALIKYWGKRDIELFLPMNSSLSLTLDRFYTDTRVIFDENLQEDVFYLNGQQTDASAISRFLDLFRQHMPAYYFARVDSYNFVPTAAGLASSASAYAALAGAANIASGLNMDNTTLSRFARRGSGSATRSLFGGFVEWDKGVDNDTSVARFIDSANWDIGMIIVLVNAKEKRLSSRHGMAHTVSTSPFYASCVETAQDDLIHIKEAIAHQDFDTLGKITEHNAMKMHATMLASNPPFSYFEPDSIRAQQAVWRLRDLGYSIYMTMDAGPNVKILCHYSEIDTILKELAHDFSPEQLLPTKPGEGLRELTEAQFNQSIAHFEENQLWQ